jgi:hypothetical protein
VPACPGPVLACSVVVERSRDPPWLLGNCSHPCWGRSRLSRSGTTDANSNGGRAPDEGERLLLPTLAGAWELEAPGSPLRVAAQVHGNASYFN